MAKSLTLVVDNAARKAARTKGARATSRARPAGTAPAPVRAALPHLSGDMTVAMAAHRILKSCMLHLLDNRLPVLKGDDPEGVHQARVALRRVRSAISIFRGVLQEPEIAYLADEAKWLARELGPVRDADVFLAETFEPVVAACPDAEGIAAYRGAVVAMQHQRLERARAALRSRRFAQWRQRFQGWLARDIAPPLALVDDQTAIGPRYRPISEFAADFLAKRNRQVRRRGRRITHLQPDRRHELRIAAKKLRYAAEFFLSIYDPAAGRGYVKRLSKLQNVLGYLNDVEAARPLMREIETLLASEPGAVAETRYISGLIIGWHSARAARAEARLRKVWLRFTDAAPFWR